MEDTAEPVTQVLIIGKNSITNPTNITQCPGLSHRSSLIMEEQNQSASQRIYKIDTAMVS